MPSSPVDHNVSHSCTIPNNPFRLPLKKPWLARMIERVLGLSILARYYDNTPALTLNSEGNVSTDFLQHTLNSVGVTPKIIDAEKLDYVPKEGTVIFVANHPLGGLEGVAMSQALQKVRPDLRVLTNLLLTKIPELSSIFIGVDVLSPNAKKENAKGIRAACKHLSGGGALLIYPAGEVSAIDKSDWTIKDKAWAPLVGKLALKYKAHVTPFYVKGKNSALFYGLGLIHERLRTLMLARELSNKRGKTLSIIAGDTISPNTLATYKTDESATCYLREKTDQLDVL